MAQSTEDTVRRFLDAYNAHDLDAVAEVLTPDAVYDDKGTGERYDGKEAVLGYVRVMFSAAPDCVWKLRSIIAGDDRAAFEGTWSGTVTMPKGSPGAGTTLPMSADAATVVDVRDGLISSLVDYHGGSGS
jgi:steroid delta-isomerase-like uncharacterized protein